MCKRVSLIYTRTIVRFHSIRIFLNSDFWPEEHLIFFFFSKVCVVSGEPKEIRSLHHNASSTATALTLGRQFRSLGGILGFGLRDDDSDSVVRWQWEGHRWALPPLLSRGCWQMSFCTKRSRSSSQHWSVGQFFSITSAESAGFWKHKLWALKQEALSSLYTVVFRLLLHKVDCFWGRKL